MEESRNSVLARVQAAAIDERMRTLRIRQRLFHSLYNHLCQNRDAFLEAARVDDDCSNEEAQIMFASTLIELRNHYNALDLTTDLEQEYSVAKNKSNEARRVAIKITYIIPDTFNLLFSVVAALTAALEAGSCVVVELENTVQKTPTLLRRCISESLDKDAFGIISSRAPADFLSWCVVVDQLQKLSTAESNATQRVLYAPASQNVAIVDRTADIRLTAKEVVASRLAFGGHGRYAIDLVLVNEFQADELTKALVDAIEKYPGSKNEAKTSIRSKSFTSSSKTPDSILINEEMTSGKVKFIQGTPQIGIVEIVDRTSSLLHCKISSRVIVISRFSSLDDPVDLLLETSQQFRIRALYVFSALREAKYLSQYIYSQATFVNHIPAQLLVGPPVPLGYPTTLSARYTRAMFELPSPQFIIGPKTHLISTIATGPAKSDWLISVAQKPLKPTGQPKSGAWGFFEQGIILGAMVYTLPLVGMSVSLVAYVSLLGYRRYI